jgi:hypothetical protein
MNTPHPMTGRQRVRAALAHREADRVPLDFGSTGVTGMHVTCVAALRQHYGLPEHPVTVIEPYQMLGEVEPDLRDALGLDTAGVLPPSTLFGIRNERWKEWRAPWGQELLVPGDFVVTPAPDGGWHIYPGGDTSAPASGHLPATGYFFDTIIRQEPLDEDHLKVEDNLEEFSPISEGDVAHFRNRVAAAAATGKAVVATLGGTAFGDIALVPAPFLKRPRGIRDVEEWYVSIAERPAFVRSIFAKQCEIGLANLAKIAAAVGDQIDVVFLCGTDFGTQISQFCSVQTFREVYQPFYRAVNEWVHQHTAWKTLKHSCGAVRPLIPELIASGFDILNPVQCSATGMEAAGLKKDFGGQITFWGGGVDTQKTLPFGSPAQVRAEVLSRCEIFSRGGGFVFNSIHNLQARTPADNLAAMFDALAEFNGRPRPQ